MKLAHLSVRVLLTLYPRRFRAEFATEMLEVFEDRYCDIALRHHDSARCFASLAALLLSTWINIVASSIAERLRSSQDNEVWQSGTMTLSRAWGRRAPSHSHEIGVVEVNSFGNNLASLAHDVRAAVREVRRDYGFFAFAALIIGLGVGANTAVFSVMSPLLLRPLPFENPDELVWVARGVSGGMSGVTSRTSNLRDFREMSGSFQALTGYDAFFEQQSYHLVGDGIPERLTAVRVAQNFLDVLSIQPLIGRNFVEEESVWNGRPAAILTHRLWTRKFAADPTLVGRTITLNDIPTDVVGILPAAFDFTSTFAPGSRVDFLLPWPICDETDQSGNTTAIIGRLRPGATVASAQADLDLVVEQLQDADPNRWGLGAVVSGLQEQISGSFRTAMVLLAAAAGAVMLIACANLSNLLLARGSKRHKELAIRSILGGSRKRLIRQLMLESLSLSLGGALIGVFIAHAATEIVARTSAVKIPMLSSVTVDGFALLFTLCVAIAAGVLIGVIPALQMSQGREASALNDASRGSSESRRYKSVREALVVLEVAVACVLLVGGGLLLRSFASVLDVELGFRADGAVAWSVDKRWPPNTSTRSTRMAYYEELVTSVQAAPGVEAVGLTDCLPLGWNRTWIFRVQGQPEDDEHDYRVFPRTVDYRYTEAMGIGLIEGRYFTPDDKQEAPRVALINESAALRMFQGEEAIGQVLLLYGIPLEVVGVVEDVRHRSLEHDSGSEVYILMPQWGWDSMNMVVRSPLPAEALFASVNEAVHAVDPTMPTGAFQTLNEMVDRAVSPRRFILILLGSFACAALLLAALGIYGVVSYSVNQRVSEIGIRMALGETSAQVLGRVVSRTMILAVLGVAIGAGGSFAASRIIDSLLFGVEPTDVFTFASMALILLGVSALAGFLPARRAARTDPIVALRTE